MSTTATVLIGFADSLSAPEVAWSLVEAGYRVVAFARKGTKPALCRSRFVRVEYVTDPDKSARGSLADLKQLVGQLDNPSVMALDDLSLWLIQELRRSLPTMRVAGATGKQAEVALDKLLQCNAARDAGFAVPATSRVETWADLKSFPGFPAIIKPRLAARVVEGRLGRDRSYTLAGEAELEAFASQWNGSEPMLVQPLLNGSGEGLFGFSLPDRVVCWSAHRRVRMMNPAGSGASACVSVEPDRATCAIAERFLKTIGWRGMFMIELLRDAAGQPWFIELNGRSWGSMALARRNGFEYPGWTARSVLDSSFIPSAPPARPAFLCRHLGRELVHLAFVWRGPRSGAQSDWPGRVKSVRDVIRVGRDDRWYNFNPRDRKVFWADVRQTLASQFLPVRRRRTRSLASRVANRAKILAARYEQAGVRARGDVRNLLEGAGRVLFVCYGNINRSALAEQHLRQLLGPRVQISSCGFHTPDGRPLDPAMRSLAETSGIPFDAWSSRTISHELVANADLIFAMEAAHLVRLRSEYPEARGRSFLLSCVTEPKTIPLEIRDPHKRSPAVYQRCIREITFATTAISNQLRKQEFGLTSAVQK
jgi:protein-tyrosine-phosphatase/predicted ATP-grasp superfamily ATP-dependent carboligase